jgi:predicted acyl esterase
MSDPEIVMSPLCREIVEDGTKIQVDIYRGEDGLAGSWRSLTKRTHRPYGMTRLTPTGNPWTP